MARQAVIDTTTGSVQRIGREGFATSDDFLGSESVQTLTDTTDFVPGVLRKHHKVVASVLTEMTQGEKDTVDATFPEILQNRHQLVVTDRDPNNNDDITKGLFDGATWFNETDKTNWILQDNVPVGSALWVNVTNSGVGISHIQVVLTADHAIPTAAALIPYDTIIADSGDLFTFDSAGTLTSTKSGSVLFRASTNYDVSSGSTSYRARIALYESTGGPYTLVAFSESRNRNTSSMEEDVFAMQIPHDVTSGNTYQVHLWRDAGTANGTAPADMVKLTAYLLEAA